LGPGAGREGSVRLSSEATVTPAAEHATGAAWANAAQREGRRGVCEEQPRSLGRRHAPDAPRTSAGPEKHARGTTCVKRGGGRRRGQGEAGGSRVSVAVNAALQHGSRAHRARPRTLATTQRTVNQAHSAASHWESRCDGWVCTHSDARSAGQAALTGPNTHTRALGSREEPAPHASDGGNASQPREQRHGAKQRARGRCDASHTPAPPNSQQTSPEKPTATGLDFGKWLGAPRSYTAGAA
jgi:hypothetical protein